jgi:stage III sporulation protein AG
MSSSTDWFNRFTRAGGSGAGPVKITRKKLWWLAGAVFLGIGLIALGNSGSKTPPPSGEKIISAGEVAAEKNSPKSMLALEEEALAVKLQSMLEEIKGAGSVRVTVRLAASAREAYAINTTMGRKTTVEKDQAGGARTINENNDTNQLVITRDGKGEMPVVEMESASKVAGVLVVAGGAETPLVKERMFEAVRVALNVEPHRILVLPGEGGAGK